MWEEHPAYQKQQAYLVGVLVLMAFATCIIDVFANHDWPRLRETLTLGGALLFVLGALSASARVVAKALCRMRRNVGDKEQTDSRKPN